MRERLNENKKLGLGVVAAIFLLAIALLGLQLRGGGSNIPPPPTTAFFTDDNGKTFFKDDINKLAPFDHNGKQAYRADVFRNPDGREYVGLIYRFTDAGRKEMEAYLSKKVKDPDGSLRLSIEHRGMQVKHVGGDEKSWILNDELTTERLQAFVKDASGKPATLVSP